MTKIKNKLFNDYRLDPWYSYFELRPTEEKWKAVYFTKESVGPWRAWETFQKQEPFWLFPMIFYVNIYHEYFWLQ